MTDNDHNLPLSGMKGRYPFRLATTSFIYPEGWAENVARLGPYFDEIELLFLESSHAHSLPDQKTIRHLAYQATELDLKYNIHLPTDICLGARSVAKRQHALDILKRVFTLTEHLPVSTHTLHMVYDEFDQSPAVSQQWQAHTRESLTRLLEWGVPASALSVENIDYPLEWVDTIITDLDLPVCLDVGHPLICGFDLEALLKRWGRRISIVHLHGAADGRDHLALDQLPEEHCRRVFQFLSAFSGVISLEVFNLNDLQRSMAFLAQTCTTFSIVSRK